jgi:GntR family transcriptional regulator/MocR family aminotransferase
VLGDFGVDLIGHMVGGDKRNGLGESQRRPFAGGEELRLPPNRQRVDTLLAFAGGAGVPAVHIDAIRASIQLRDPQAEELAETDIELNTVELLLRCPVEVRHCAREGLSDVVEVESDSDLIHLSCPCRHTSTVPGLGAMIWSNYMPKNWATSGVDLHVVVDGAHRRADLEAALREAVRSGRIGAGTRLPPTRALAADLGLARNTVAAAYAQLVAEGWLDARQGAGTWVAARAAATQPEPVQPATDSRPPRYDMRSGSPDLAAFPRAEWLRASQRALRSSATGVLGYPDPLGRLELRTALAVYLARARGVDASAERVIVCSGFGQALAVVAAALREHRTSGVAIEAYTHPSHAATLTAFGLTTIPIDVDDSGVRFDDIDDTGSVGAALLTPAHQFPLGPTLVPPRRLAAVEWARANAAFIIEDDYDGEFRYDRQPIGAMQALAPERVIYAGTASKTLAPGLRLGWLVVPASLREAALEAKRLSDGPGTVDQLTMAELIVSGTYDRHIRRARLGYRRRRDRLVAALKHCLPDTRVGGAAAGMHLVVQLPRGLSEEEAVARGRARELALEGLGNYRLGARRHTPALVVGYGTPPEHAFDAAVRRLCSVFND